jgi:hypothetical protein
MPARKTPPAGKPRTTTTRTPDAALADLTLKDDVLLSTAQAAALVCLTAKTMRQLRSDRSGPRCYKLGAKKQSRTVYRRSDLERWINANARPVGGA